MFIMDTAMIPETGSIGESKAPRVNAMITTASMFAAMNITPEMLDCNLVYLAMAIGSGSLIGDWMNNSGFWIFARMSGLTEIETLKSWTILTAALGLIGLAFTLLFSKLFPML